MAPDTTKSLNLLLVLPSWVGDTVMAAPSIRALRAAQPYRNATITAYHRPGLSQLLLGSNLVDHFLAVGHTSGFVGPFIESRLLRQRGFDSAILLPNSFRYALTVFLAGIPNRIGYARDGRSILLTRALEAPLPGGFRQPISAVDYYLGIARMLAPESDPGEFDRRIALAPSAEQIKSAQEILHDVGVHPERERLVLLNPGANRADKRWPADRYAALAEYLSERSESRILLNGSPAECGLLNSIAAACRKSHPVNLSKAGVNLGTLLALCSMCSLVVTNDTGTRHIAAAAGFDLLIRAEVARQQLIGSGAEVLVHRRPPRLLSLFGPTDPAWAEIDYPLELQLRAATHSMADLGVDEVRRAALDSLHE